MQRLSTWRDYIIIFELAIIIGFLFYVTDYTFSQNEVKNDNCVFFISITLLVDLLKLFCPVSWQDYSEGTALPPNLKPFSCQVLLTIRCLGVKVLKCNSSPGRCNWVPSVVLTTCLC